MKKVFSLMLLLATLLTFTACGGDDDEPKDTLKGTEWTHGLTERVEHIEFTSETQVEYYHTKNDALIGNVGSGTYTKNGNEIVFHNFEGNYNTEIMTFKSAKLQGNTLTVYYESSYFGETSTTFRKTE